MIRDIKYDSNRVMSSKLFIMVPHSGRNYEKKFLKLTKVRFSELRKSEDCFVDLIFKDLTLKFNFLSANFPRIFVDVNRSPLEIDINMWKNIFVNKARFNNTSKVLSGIGVFPKISFNGNLLYENSLPYSEARKRLLNYYFPYHKKLKNSLKDIKSYFNNIVALDCHSMASIIVDKNTDIILSNNYGKTSSMIILNNIKDIFNMYGFKVKINTPFVGGFISKFYGKPDKGMHLIQIEINKKIYLSENNFILREEGFNKLKNCFSAIINYINKN